MSWKNFLCKLGFHKWDKPVKVSHGFSSNVLDVKKKCTRCKKTKKWVETK